MAKISVKHALNVRQVRFCEYLHAAGGAFRARAYKQAFCFYREADGQWVALDDEDIDLSAVSKPHRDMLIERAIPLDGDLMQRRADTLCKNKLVAAYLKELDLNARELADSELREQLITGSLAERRKAAELIRQDRERLDFSSAVSAFWRLTGEVLAKVVKRFPGEARKVVTCPSCHHEHEVAIPIETRFPGCRYDPVGTLGAGMGPRFDVTPEDLESGEVYIEYDAEAKLSLLDLAGAPWSDVDPDATLSPLQVEHFQRRERTKLLHGGSGVGKSVVGAGDCIVAIMIPGNVVRVIGAMYDNCEKEFAYIDQAMRRLFPNLAAFRRIACLNRLNYHDMECSTIWGSECFASSMESNDGKATLGETIHHATISEAAQVSSSIINKRVIRALDRALMKKPGFPFARETGTLTLPTTPDEHRGAGCSGEILKQRRKLTKNKLEQLHYGRTRYEETFHFREASVLENPAYNVEVYEANKRTMKPHEFEEVYEGKMTSASGKIYHQFTQARHVRPMPSRVDRQAMQFALAIDTGAYFAANLAGITRSKELWLLGEAHSEKETTKKQCAAVVEMVLRVMPYDFEGDVSRALARIALHIIDPSSPFKLDIMENLPAFNYTSPTRDQGKFDLMPTIGQVGEFFEADKLFIVDELDFTLDELEQYVWKSQRSPSRQGQYMVREPARDHDHHMDASRMALIPLYELGPLMQVTQEDLVDFYRQQAIERVHNPLRQMLQTAERMGGRWC